MIKPSLLKFSNIPPKGLKNQWCLNVKIHSTELFAIYMLYITLIIILFSFQTSKCLHIKEICKKCYKPNWKLYLNIQTQYHNCIMLVYNFFTLISSVHWSFSLYIAWLYIWLAKGVKIWLAYSEIYHMH